MQVCRTIVLAGGFLVASSLLFAQVTAGGKQEFEAASVRPDDSGQHKPASFPLTDDDSFPGGNTLFHADFTLDTYITFAYKVWETPNLRREMLAGQPGWVGDQYFRIQARMPENATKDQVRSMMQSLLAERFGLKVHFESRDTPVLALTLAKRGVLGPKLRPHEEGRGCSVAPSSDADVFPLTCGTTEMKRTGPLVVVGARNVTMDKLASFLSTFGPLDDQFAREVIDQTGLQGRYDYTVEFARKSLRDSAAVDTGPSLMEALSDQLGMKLTPKRAVVQRLIIDHVERPLSN